MNTPVSIRFLLFLLGFFSGSISFGQCAGLTEEIDPFDSTRVILHKPVNLGGLVASRFALEDGDKMVEEAKALVSYADNDSLESFFLTLALLEWDYQVLDAGPSVSLLLGNQSVVALETVEDRGTLDSKTNMRRYEAVCVIPVDLFYALHQFKVTKMSVHYRSGHKRTISLFPDQQNRLQVSLRCVGEKAGWLPINP